MRNILQDFQTDQMKGVRETDKSKLKFWAEQLCEWCAIYKGSSGSLGEEQVCRGGKGGEGRCIKDPEFYLEHINFMLPFCCPNGDIRKLVSCRPMSLYSGS